MSCMHCIALASPTAMKIEKEKSRKHEIMRGEITRRDGYECYDDTR